MLIKYSISPKKQMKSIHCSTMFLKNAETRQFDKSPERPVPVFFKNIFFCHFIELISYFGETVYKLFLYIQNFIMTDAFLT